MLGLLARLGAALSLTLFLRSRDEPSPRYWLGYAVLSALAAWVLFR